MSAASNDWSQWLFRQGRDPSGWLRDLLSELEPALKGLASPEEQACTASWLLDNPYFGRFDRRGFLDDEALHEWEERLNSELRAARDCLEPAPSGALPTLVRELAQCLNLKGFDPVGARPGEDALRIGWQKNLTAQGCDVYRWERETTNAAPQDWVPRLRQPLGQHWPQAPGVSLPIFFVTPGQGDEHEGLNGWLRIWLWPCDGAQLEFLPSVPQRVQPLTQSWQRGLEQASNWMRRQMQGQGGRWKDHALVWEVHSNESAYVVLGGASASAAFALAGLWLAREWAPAQWVSQLCSMGHDDWRNVRITAAIRTDAPGDGPAGDLCPVGGVGVKGLANWVLGQGRPGRQPVLHVARQQMVELAAPGQPMPQIHRHDGAYDLLKTLARQALDLSDAHGLLLGALQPHLHAFAPDVEAGSVDQPWHLPALGIPRRFSTADALWRNTVDTVANDASLPASLTAFALHRWAARATGQQDGSSVHSLFVNLSVSHEHQATLSPTPHSGQGENNQFFLDQLLASYEQDSERPAQKVQALQIVGAPGSGKTWLLARLEQACSERLLWQIDRQARKPELTDAAQAATDPYRHLDVPLYVSLGQLPIACDTPDAIVNWFRAQVLGGPDAPDSALRLRLCSPSAAPHIRLRIILDEVNELKVSSNETRQARTTDVIRALWDQLRPGLPMLLGTRQHDRYELGHLSATGLPFKVAVASIDSWSPLQFEMYLRQRWAGAAHAHLLAQVDEIMRQIRFDAPQGPCLREVLGLPLYLRIQCELFEAGAKELLDNRARLLAVRLWHALMQELKPGLSQGDALEKALPELLSKGRIQKALAELVYSIWLRDSKVPESLNGDVAGWIMAADPASTLLETGADLKRLVKQLRSAGFLDIQAVRDASDRQSSITIEGNNGAYKIKYEPKHYVRRRDVEERLQLVLEGELLPVLFMKAGSGQGKTCFVRNQHFRLANSADSIPLLVRGVSGPSQHVRVREHIKGIAEQVAGTSDSPDTDPIDILDQALALRNVKFVVILDGVNEAKGDHADIFNEAISFLSDRIDRCRKMGFFTSFRLIITSRPVAFDAWYGDFDYEGMLSSVQRAGAGAGVEIDGNESVVELNNLSEDELDEALSYAGLAVDDSTMRTLLADPLLLGFYRELSKAEGDVFSGLPLTPLSLINLYWEKQSTQIEKLATKDNVERGSDDYLAAIKIFCQQMLEKRDSVVEVNWEERYRQILVGGEILLFEQFQTTQQPRYRASNSQTEDAVYYPLAFRYDRLAQLLVAKFAILENPDGSQRSASAISDLLIRNTLETMREATFAERDLIRGSFIDALTWRMDNEGPISTTSTFELALGLLNPAHPALEDVEQPVVDSCLLALSEIVHDFLVHSGRWHGPRIVRHIRDWFSAHRDDESSRAARVLRRTVFGLLRGNNLGNGAASAALQANAEDRLVEARRAMLGLAAIALVTDASGDPAVLLNALYREGKSDDALAILKESVDHMVKSRFAIWTPGGLSGLQRVGLALLLIAPDGLKNKRFLDCVKVVFKQFPPSLIATTASLLTDMALNDNVMPFRKDEWIRVKSVEDQFRAVVRLLSEDAWTDAGMADHASVEGIRLLSGKVRNGIIAQLLSNALSCQILRAQQPVRSQLIADLKQMVEKMCEEAKALSITDESDTACELGSAAYLISLVFYHLVVFDAPQNLELEGRAFLARDNAEQVMECMWRLADDVLLRPPFLGRFRFRPGTGPLETSNVVGTLGRAALEMGQLKRFQDLLRKKTVAFAVGPVIRSLTVNQHLSLLQDSDPFAPPNAALRQVAFADFLLDSLATMGTLTQEPEFALKCIYDTAVLIGAPGFATTTPAKENDFSLISMASTMKALVQVRAVHPFAVEKYIVKRQQDKRRAAPVLRHIRLAVPAHLSRHLSWTFEHCVERIIADYPDAVRFVRDDMLDNLHPRGLRVLAARSVYRLLKWASIVDESKASAAMVLSARQRAFARFAGLLGGVGGPIGSIIKQFRKQAKAPGTEIGQSAVAGRSG